MYQATKTTITDLINQLSAAHSCCPEAKQAAQDYLAAIDTPNELTAAQRLLAELAQDIVLVDDLIAFARSESANQLFGTEGAKNLAAHGQALKAGGVPYCDCPACTAALAILKLGEDLLV